MRNTFTHIKYVPYITIALCQTINYVAKNFPYLRDFNIYSYMPLYNTSLSYVAKNTQYLYSFATNHLSFMHKHVPAPVYCAINYTGDLAQKAITFAIILSTLRALYQNISLKYIYEDLFKNKGYCEPDVYKPFLSFATSAFVGYCAYKAVENFIISSPAVSIIAGVVAGITTAHYLHNYNMMGYNALKDNSLTVKAIAKTTAKILDDFVMHFTTSLGYAIHPMCLVKLNEFLKELEQKREGIEMRNVADI